MKKTLKALLPLILLVTGVLVGCSEDQTTAKEVDPSKAEQKEVSNKKEDVSEPVTDENGRVLLTEVGQKVKEEDGTSVELLKIKEVNQSVDIAPVKVVVTNMKVIQLTDIHPDNTDYLLQFMNASELPEELNYIQINYSAENTSDKNIGWNGISTIVTNTGEQLDAMGNDFIWEENGFDSTFYGKTKHEGTIGVFTTSNVDELKSLKFIISSSYDEDTYEDITSEQQAEFGF
ncbi:hypothetical protein MHH33_07120 [Paenisporosarcina sp. FSL H8-0542]|uniref:hypothetical protein n=1 Tax=Paenisporosarcina sp. FSL H8-0542 TaxID=2921401 RepID=UPI003159F8A1